MPVLLPLLLLLAMRGPVPAERGPAIVENGRDIRDLLRDDSLQREAICALHAPNGMPSAPFYEDSVVKPLWFILVSISG